MGTVRVVTPEVVEQSFEMLHDTTLALASFSVHYGDFSCQPISCGPRGGLAAAACLPSPLGSFAQPLGVSQSRDWALDFNATAPYAPGRTELAVKGHVLFADILLPDGQLNEAFGKALLQQLMALPHQDSRNQ